jgi:hypothetical protein
VFQTFGIISIVGPMLPWHGASSGCGWRGGLHIWMVAANMLNKQSRTDDKSGPPTWGLCVGLTTSYRKKQFVRKCYTGPRTWIVLIPVDCSCEHGNEPLLSINCCEITE